MAEKSVANGLKGDLLAKEEEIFTKELLPEHGNATKACILFMKPLWDKPFVRLAEEWVLMFILGISMAIISFIIDVIVVGSFIVRMEMYHHFLSHHWGIQLISWLSMPLALVLFSAWFSNFLAPLSVGPGVPEMKTILRGVVMKEYLTWKVLIAKVIGLATVMGSGMPLGKEGPVMQIACIIACKLSKMMRHLKEIVDDEARFADFLAAASTMGVAVSYSAPVGGVLFSIEVTTAYFAVRNYWKGFFSAVVGATFYQLLRVWFMDFDHFRGKVVSKILPSLTVACSVGK